MRIDVGQTSYELDPIAAYIRNTDPGSTAGIPGLSIPAGFTDAGIPIGVSLDSPVGTDGQLFVIGQVVQALIGVLPPPNFLAWLTVPQRPDADATSV